ncbi:MAG: hypothetical protein ACXW61_00540 [Gemmatirosa sp.]
MPVVVRPLRPAALVAAGLLLASPLRAQQVLHSGHDHGPSTRSTSGLRGKIAELFIFGPGQDPLFLAGSAGASNPASVQAHGTHFIPSAAASNGSIIGFIGQALSTSVASIPIGATTSGETFRFEGGVPVSTATSAGPIFAERAQTLGRGRVLAGMNRSSFNFSSLRGVPIRDLQVNFTHENTNAAGCSAENGGQDCAQYGVPVLENEVMAVTLDLDIDVAVTSFYVTYGVTDRIDFGIAVPVLQNSFRGTSSAQILPFGGENAVHFFAGTPQNPVLSAMRSTSASAFGIGDVAARLKVNATNSARTGVAFLLDARFPTGEVDNLMGTGEFVGRGLAVVSSRFGNFSPHANAGYLFRADRELANDAVLATLGFDHLLGKGVTLAADVLAELQVGSNRLELPGTVQFDAPFRRTVDPTNIPAMRDDVVNGSFGFKFTTASRVTGIANALFPLNDGGLRPNATFTLGVEYSF